MNRIFPTSALQRLDARTVLAVAMAGLFVFLVGRGIGIYPVVFADEWSYSSFSRLLPLSEAGVPSYLYLLLYGTTSTCGDGFLECARVLNCVFVVVAMPFIYQVARLVCGPLLACLVAVLAVLGPINTYAIYFMPEAMYFMGFWMLTWLVLTRDKWPAPAFGLAVGFAGGLLSLVKVHALFILPALVAYGFCLPFLRQDEGRWRRALAIACAIAAAFLATKFLLGYLLAGKAGLSLFGSLYGAQAAGASGGAAARAVALAPKALSSLAGHVMALGVLFTLPLACVVTGLPVRLPRDGSGADAAPRIRLYTALVLATLVAVVAVFTAGAEGSGPLETAGRLHMRYYNFALPLLLVVAAAEFRSQADAGALRGLGAGILVAVAGYAAFALVPAYTPSMVDSPELRGVTGRVGLFTAIGVLSIVATIAWVLRPRWGAALFLFVLVPVIAVTGTLKVGQEVRQRKTPDLYDEAGQFGRRYLGADVARLTVVAPHPAPLLRALFHLDSIHAGAHQQPEGTKLVLQQFPKDTAWLLLIGKYELEDGQRSSLDFGKYSLVHVARERRLDFRAAEWPGVTHKSGLSWPEPWGTWTNGRDVMIEFATTLPRRFELTLIGHAFGANGTFPVRVGGTTRTFQLPAEDAASSAVFETDGNERIIRISVPHPAVPQALGLGDDPREIGLGLRQLTIKAIK